MDEDVPIEENGANLSDREWSDWEEKVDPVVCLFCEESGSFELSLSHMRVVHKFDFTDLCLKNGMNFYQQVCYIF